MEELVMDGKAELEFLVRWYFSTPLSIKSRKKTLK